jgi:hypothetical protein
MRLGLFLGQSGGGQKMDWRCGLLLPEDLFGIVFLWFCAKIKSMKHKITILLIVISAIIISAFFLFSKSGKKVEFKKASEQTVAENAEIESKQENNQSTENVSSPAAESSDNAEENKVEAKDEDIKKEPTSAPKITNKLVNWGYGQSFGRKIDTVIVHSSYNALGGDEYDIDMLLKEYKNYGVAPHYVVNRKGNIIRLVEDKNIAYHAGESKTPDGRKGVNNFSIGIEMVNTKSDKYTDAQYRSLKYLISYLKDKYSIKYTLGHKDISPGRKDDPWNFEWEKVK